MTFEYLVCRAFLKHLSTKQKRDGWEVATRCGYDGDIGYCYTNFQTNECSQIVWLNDLLIGIENAALKTFNTKAISG